MEAMLIIDKAEAHENVGITSYFIVVATKDQETDVKVTNKQETETDDGRSATNSAADFAVGTSKPTENREEVNKLLCSVVQVTTVFVDCEA